MSEPAQPPIPVTVIGGYLGAGKTTLVNHLLRNANGLRIAVLVNDFGALQIDADLIEAADGDTISLANGCICCSLAGGLVEAMLGILDRPQPPEWVVIETSGVSDPVAAAGLPARWRDRRCRRRDGAPAQHRSSRGSPRAAATARRGPAAAEQDGPDHHRPTQRPSAVAALAGGGPVLAAVLAVWLADIVIRAGGLLAGTKSSDRV